MIIITLIIGVKRMILLNFEVLDWPFLLKKTSFILKIIPINNISRISIITREEIIIDNIAPELNKTIIKFNVIKTFNR